MPPSTTPLQRTVDTDHQLPEGRHSHVGPLIGAVIIIVLLAFGALYFYGEYLNRQNSDDQLPLIQGNA